MCLHVLYRRALHAQRKVVGSDCRQDTRLPHNINTSVVVSLWGTSVATSYHSVIMADTWCAPNTNAPVYHADIYLPLITLSVLIHTVSINIYKIMYVHNFIMYL